MGRWVPGRKEQEKNGCSRQKDKMSTDRAEILSQMLAITNGHLVASAVNHHLDPAGCLTTLPLPLERARPELSSPQQRKQIKSTQINFKSSVTLALHGFPLSNPISSPFFLLGVGLYACQANIRSPN